MNFTFQLRGQLQAGPSEIAKAAQSLSELSELWQPEDELSGIDIIEQDQRVLVRILLLCFVLLSISIDVWAFVVRTILD